MTVAEVITKIGKIMNAIDYLDELCNRLNLMNGDAVVIENAKSELKAYVDELESKIVC